MVYGRAVFAGDHAVDRAVFGVFQPSGIVFVLIRHQAFVAEPAEFAAFPDRDAGAPPPVFLGRGAVFTPGTQDAVAPEAGAFEVVGGPASGVPVAGGEDVRPFLEMSDAGFDGAVVTGQVAGGVQRFDAPSGQEPADFPAGEGAVIVGLEHERRAVFDKQGLKGGGHFGVVGDALREGGELVVAGEVADGQEIRRAAVDGRGRFAVVHGPDRAGAGPFEGGYAHMQAGAAGFAEFGQEVAGLVAAELGHQRQQAAEAQGRPDVFHEFEGVVAEVVVGACPGTSAPMGAESPLLAGATPGGETGRVQAQKGGGVERCLSASKALGDLPDDALEGEGAAFEVVFVDAPGDMGGVGSFAQGVAGGAQKREVARIASAVGFFAPGGSGAGFISGALFFFPAPAGRAAGRGA